MAGCRIFLSYRGKSEGKDFCKQLYEYMKNDPYYEDKYGDVYYSDETAGLGDNFVIDIPSIITEDTEYFVMPLTDNYFKDFWDEEKDCPNPRSVTHKEITQALKTNCKFIIVKMTDSKIDEKLLFKLYGEASARIISSVKLNEGVTGVAHKLVRKLDGAYEVINKEKKTAFITFKDKAQANDVYPFYAMMNDVEKITLLNYASSSFIMASNIARTYKNNIMYWFSDLLKSGAIEADIILTHPYSYAATDAALYKMYPGNLNGMTKDDIIINNLNKLYWVKRENPNAKLNIYLTSIALPYGVMIANHSEKKNNHMKVDLYAPVTDSDDKRPSFYLLKNDPDTSEMYKFFEDNVANVKRRYAMKLDGLIKLNWLSTDKPIIHKGLIKNGLIAHSKQAIRSVVDADYPLEIDLMQLRDGTIVVGRDDDQDLSDIGKHANLSEYKASEFKSMNRKLNDDSRRVLTLKELLDLVNGKIPLFIEIKTNGLELDENTRKEGELPELQERTKSYVSNIIEILKKYAKSFGIFTPETETKGFAIHCSNPYVIRYIKTLDCLIPCGIITTDFAPIKDKVGDEFYELHSECKYLDIITPDFICCNVDYMEEFINKRVHEKYGIPLIAWTIKDEDSEEEAKSYDACKSFVIEGAKTYIVED